MQHRASLLIDTVDPNIQVHMPAGDNAFLIDTRAHACWGTYSTYTTVYTVPDGASSSSFVLSHQRDRRSKQQRKQPQWQSSGWSREGCTATMTPPRSPALALFSCLALSSVVGRAATERRKGLSCRRNFKTCFYDFCSIFPRLGVLYYHVKLPTTPEREA